MTFYEDLAQRFNEKMGLVEGTTPTSLREFVQFDMDGHRELMEELEWRRRFSQVQEEVGEVEDAINDGDFEQAEQELADVAVTVFTMADTLNVDLERLYVEKMEHNLQKSGELTETGKVVDDA